MGISTTTRTVVPLLAVTALLVFFTGCLEKDAFDRELDARIDARIDARLAERGYTLAPRTMSSAGGGSAETCSRRGFNPCDPSRANDPNVAAVCQRVEPWLAVAPTQSGDPCAQVVDRCKGAGYYQGGFEVGRGLYFDCVTPLLLGQAVCDVQIDAQVPAACMSQSQSSAATAPGRSRRWMPWRGDPSDPCQPIMQACNAAGFYQGGVVEGLGIYTNCRDPLLQGQAVAGASVAPDQITACKTASGVAAATPAPAQSIPAAGPWRESALASKIAAAGEKVVAQKDVRVGANQPWINTGLSIGAGQRLWMTTQTSGKWSGNATLFPFSDAKGLPVYPAEYKIDANAPVLSLIGFVGADPPTPPEVMVGINQRSSGVGGTSSDGFVEAGNTLLDREPKTTGLVWLRNNDNTNAISDVGEQLVRVVVTSR